MLVRTDIFGDKKVEFIKVSDWGYQAIVITIDGKEKRKIPLILGEYDMSLVISKLDKINKVKNFPFDYFYNIVAGSIQITIASGK